MPLVDSFVNEAGHPGAGEKWQGYEGSPVHGNETTLEHPARVEDHAMGSQFAIGDVLLPNAQVGAVVNVPSDGEYRSQYDDNQRKL